MKKRKELDALIGLGDSKRKKTKKGSGHRLLRTEPPLDSESESSSDDDEFSNLATVAAFGKRSYVKCCNVCYPLFLFIILAACVTACAGLIWMQIALKEDLDSLKEKLHTMESGQKVSSHEIPKLSEDLKTKQRKLEDIENGDKGLNKLWSNLTEINRKISFLDTAVNHLKANIKSASDLINLPTTVEELQKSVASIGSTLTSVQHDVKTIQTALEDQKKETDDLKRTMDAEAKESNVKSTASVEKETSNRSSTLAQNQDVTHLREVVSEVNKTQGLYHSWTGDQIQNLQTAVSNLTHRVSSMEQGSPQTTPHSDLVEVVEQLPVSGDATEPVKDLVTERDTNADGLKAATSEATHEKSTGSKPTRRPWFLTPQIIRPVSLIMDLKYLAVMAVLAVATYAPFSQAKPISLVERCWCRSTVNTVPQRNIRELKFLHTPNCPFQVIAKLKNHKEVCINPETKWLQQYLKNALNKMKKAKQTN